MMCLHYCSSRDWISPALCYLSFSIHEILNKGLRFRCCRSKHWPKRASVCKSCLREIGKEFCVECHGFVAIIFLSSFTIEKQCSRRIRFSCKKNSSSIDNLTKKVIAICVNKEKNWPNFQPCRCKSGCNKINCSSNNVSWFVQARNCLEAWKNALVRVNNVNNNYLYSAYLDLVYALYKK